MANQTQIAEQLWRIENAKNTLGDKAHEMDLRYDGDSISSGDNIDVIAAAFDDIPVVTAEAITVKNNKVNIPTGYRGQDTEVSISTSGKTATATVEGKSISADVNDGAYIVATSDAVVQKAEVGASGTNITITEVDSIPENTTDSYIAVSGEVDAIVTANATIDTAGYIEKGSKSVDELVEVSTAPKYYHLNNGTVELSGGGLSKGTGYVRATITGANFSLSEPTSSTPASGTKYITATGSGRVNRAAIGYTTTSGVVGNGTVDGDDLEDNGILGFGTTSLESNDAIKYYTIPNTVVDTQSGTAVASDILSGSKAWVNGNELTGSMTNRGAVERTIEILDDENNSPTSWDLGNGYVSGVSLTFNYDNLLNRLRAI